MALSTVSDFGVGYIWKYIYYLNEGDQKISTKLYKTIEGSYISEYESLKPELLTDINNFVWAQLNSDNLAEYFENYQLQHIRLDDEVYGRMRTGNSPYMIELDRNGNLVHVENERLSRMAGLNNQTIDQLSEKEYAIYLDSAVKKIKNVIQTQYPKQYDSLIFDYNYYKTAVQSTFKLNVHNINTKNGIELEFPLINTSALDTHIDSAIQILLTENLINDVDFTDYIDDAINTADWRPTEVAYYEEILGVPFQTLSLNEQSKFISFWLGYKTEPENIHETFGLWLKNKPRDVLEETINFVDDMQKDFGKDN